MEWAIPTTTQAPIPTLSRPRSKCCESFCFWVASPNIVNCCGCLSHCCSKWPWFRPHNDLKKVDCSVMSWELHLGRTCSGTRIKLWQTLRQGLIPASPYLPGAYHFQDRHHWEPWMTIFTGYLRVIEPPHSLLKFEGKHPEFPSFSGCCLSRDEQHSLLWSMLIALSRKLCKYGADCCLFARSSLYKADLLDWYVFLAFRLHNG